MLTRVAVSMMRTATLIRRSRVLNSALASGCGLGRASRRCQQQPIGGSMQHEAPLIGQWGAATGAIGGKLGLVKLDQVLGLTTLAIQSVVEPYVDIG